MDKRYFHTYDALRFFACLKVFLLHIPVTGISWFNSFKQGGGLGVQFFFVLSGFLLITYIILEEYEQTQRFNLKRFFLRRILRIWPLYYLMVLFAFLSPVILGFLGVQYSSEGYEPNFFYSLFFVENYKMMMEAMSPNVSPLTVMWSLCIEEHFYIVWGLMFFFMPKRYFVKVAIFLIFVSLIARYVYGYYNISTIDIVTNIDLFALGGLLAYFLIQYKAKIENAIVQISKSIKIVVIVIIVLFLYLTQGYTNALWLIFQPLVVGVLFTILLALFIPSNNNIKISDQHIFTKWGRVTYGLYLFHTIVISLIMKIFDQCQWRLDNYLNLIVFILISFIISIFLSHLSYQFIERPFLNLKRFFVQQKLSVN